MASVGRETAAQIRQQLRAAETGIEAALLNVLAQERLVERLKSVGRSADLAERLLVSFKDLLTLRIASRDRMKSNLEGPDGH
jgi:hypothetical protein